MALNTWNQLGTRNVLPWKSTAWDKRDQSINDLIDTATLAGECYRICGSLRLRCWGSRPGCRTCFAAGCRRSSCRIGNCRCRRVRLNDTDHKFISKPVALSLFSPGKKIQKRNTSQQTIRTMTFRNRSSSQIVQTLWCYTEPTRAQNPAKVSIFTPSLNRCLLIISFFWLNFSLSLFVGFQKVEKTRKKNGVRNEINKWFSSNFSSLLFFFSFFVFVFLSRFPDLNNSTTLIRNSFYSFHWWILYNPKR